MTTIAPHCIKHFLSAFFAFFWIFSGSSLLKAAPLSSITLTCPADITFTVNGAGCSTTVQLINPQANSIGCPGAVQVAVQSALGNGNGPFVNVAIGKYLVNCTATNACGDVANCSYWVTVKETKKPVPVLVNTLYANLTENGTVKIRAWQLNQGSTDNCTPSNQLKYAWSPVVSDSVKTFTCAQIGLLQTTIWVFDLSGNKMSAGTKIEIMDAAGHCLSTPLTGILKTEGNFTMPNVPIRLESTIFPQVSTLTSASGAYFFDDLPLGNSFHIEPSYDEFPKNGLSTIDLALINKHILGEQLLNSPYKIIAADVNQNGAVTLSDLSELRKLILGEIDDFTNNSSWKFIPENYVFQNPTNPFTPVFPQSINITPLSPVNTPMNFIGIKIGDVNNSAALGLQSDIDDRQNRPIFNLFTTAKSFTEGETFTLAFECREMDKIEGFQFTIDFDMQKLSLQSITPGNLNGMNFANIGITHLKKGLFTVSWNGLTENQNNNKTIILATFTAKAAGETENAIHMSDAVTPSEAFDNRGTMNNLDLIFDGSAQSDSSIKLYPNSPNPFMEMTLLRFNLPGDSEVKLHIVNQQGQIVFERAGSFQTGENHFFLQRKDLSHPGVYFYTMESDYGTANRKLIMF